jgi:cyclopropane fatty-acyl-phospholipid synthase-like methyltransferase
VSLTRGRRRTDTGITTALPKPAVAPEEYDADYYRHSCAGTIEWDTSEGRERHLLYDGCLDRAGLRADGDILDVGTGRGELLVAAIERGARRAVGVEYADAAVELSRTALARADLGDRAEVLKTDTRALPVPDVSFDLVTMLDVVEDMTAVELAAALHEAYQGLRPDGRIFIHTCPTAGCTTSPSASSAPAGRGAGVRGRRILAFPWSGPCT